MRIIQFAKSLLIFVLAFSAITILTDKINANPVKLTEDQKGIIGSWQFKKSVSETKKSSKANILPVVFAPESLVLAADNNLEEITINEGFKEFIQTNTLPTDGTIITKNIFQVGKVSAKAYWEEKSLFIEVTTANGDKVTEKFELSPNKKQLFVTIKSVEKNSAKGSKIVRVYDRIADVDEENNVAQVGITDYPF